MQKQRNKQHLNGLKERFSKAFDRFSRSEQRAARWTGIRAEYERKNKLRYGGWTVRDLFLCGLFVLMLAVMTPLDYLMVAPLVDLLVDGRSDYGQVIQVAISFLAVAMQVMLVYHNKRLEERYEMDPDFEPKGLRWSRRLKFMPPIVMYVAATLYKLVMLEGMGDPMIVIGALFGFIAILLLAALVHLVFILLGRPMLDAVGKMQYTFFNGILKRFDHRAKVRCAKAEQKLGTLANRLVRDLESALRKYPDDRHYFSMQFSKEEEAYLRTRFGTTSSHGAHQASQGFVSSHT